MGKEKRVKRERSLYAADYCAADYIYQIMVWCGCLHSSVAFIMVKGLVQVRSFSSAPPIANEPRPQLPLSKFLRFICSIHRGLGVNI